MKKILLALWLLLSLHASCIAKTDADSSKSLLWKISGNDMRKPSYLFGTIHLICPKDYLWTPVMNQSLATADQVCFEMDLDDPQLMIKIAQGMVNNQNDSTLKDYFTPEQYNMMKQFVKDSLGMDISMFDNMKPAALETVFTMNIIECGQPLTYETELMALAKTQNKEITGIEEPEEQIALFNSMPPDSIISSITDIIKGGTESRKEYQKMVNAYKEQDLPALYNIMKQAEGMSGALLNMFLDARNEKWIERMTDKMDQQSIFFAFGAGHLPGQKGVIELLRNAGYTVEPLK